MKDKKNLLKINEERFIEELDRITRYLSMIKERRMSSYECVSILEDLGVIIDKGNLNNFEVIEELGNHLSK